MEEQLLYIHQPHKSCDEECETHEDSPLFVFDSAAALLLSRLTLSHSMDHETRKYMVKQRGTLNDNGTAKHVFELVKGISPYLQRTTVQ